MPISKTALKFLKTVHPVHGTHHLNLKSYYGKLVDAGLVKDGNYPFVHLTDAGREALRSCK